MALVKIGFCPGRKIKIMTGAKGENNDWGKRPKIIIMSEILLGYTSEKSNSWQAKSRNYHWGNKVEIITGACPVSILTCPIPAVRTEPFGQKSL